MKRLSAVEFAAVIVGVVALVGAVFTIYIFTKNEVTVEAIAKAKPTFIKKKKEQPAASITESLIKSSELERKEEPKISVNDSVPTTNAVTDHIAKPVVPITTEVISARKDLKEKAIEKKAIEKKAMEKEVIEKKKIEKKSIEKKSMERDVIEKKAIEKKDIKKKAQQPLSKKKPAIERRLKQVELNRLMANVYDLKANNVNRKACVFIRQTSGSNVVGGLTDVSRFLQSRGFVIAGRERIQGKVTGVKVRWPNECVTITIGSVE